MEVRVGKVTHYYNQIGVAVIQLSGELSVGDTILILGHTTDCMQPVASLEIEHQKVQSAGPNMEVALKVLEPVRKGDKIYKVSD
jgi:putative protease